MAGPETNLVDRLLQAESPYEVNDWTSRDGYYVAACRVGADDVDGLIDIVRKWNDLNWPADDERPDVEDFELLPVTAWRALGDLKAESAVTPLIEVMCAADEENDDWVPEELPHVFGKIGNASLDPLLQLAVDDASPEYVRSIAVRGLGCLAEQQTATRDRIVSCLTELMVHATSDQIILNTELLSVLVDLQAVEAAEAIERAFAGNLLDVGMEGDWETVRQELGVKGLGLTMPANPQNSLEEFRRRMGIGIFSERPVFGMDGVNPEAEEKYYRRAGDTFSKSSEAQQVIDRYGQLAWFLTLLDFGVNYLGETVDEMSQASVEEFLFDHVPRKFSIESGAAAEIVSELLAFWEYVDRVYNLPAAKSIVDWLKSDGLVDQLKDELSDSSNFGMAKSMVMMGREAGYDMTSEAGLNQFMMAYNASLLSSRQETNRQVSNRQDSSPTIEKQPAGRNDPCPCGSGKKFKKCCARLQ